MSKKVYKDLLNALDRAEIPVKESEYTWRNSGVWNIAFGTSPTLGISWDGKKQELEVSTTTLLHEQAGLPGGKNVLIREAGRCAPAAVIMAKLFYIALRGPKAFSGPEKKK
jgi:hypothetical protein